MLTDAQIKKICLAAAIIGCIGIILSGNYIGPEKLKISQISRERTGQIIETSGYVDKFSTKDGHVFIQLKDGNEKISVIMFERTARNQKSVYEIEKGKNITVIGKIAVYKNELEIQANSILLKEY